LRNLFLRGAFALAAGGGNHLPNNAAVSD
jgi:hypothetical protein